MTSPNTLTPGTVFGGYRIDRLLGRGGMGTVYAAEQVDDGRIVAVKVLSANLASNEDRERFLREGRTAAAINHPNTVYVYRTEEIAGVPTIAMELVDGGTLEEKVERLGPLSVSDAIHDTLQIIDGLDAAERMGILHRDIKPANCFVGLSGDVKVGDFGLSRPVDQVDQVRLTQTGLFLGTPVFSSPEQLMGETLDLRSDIYAVGATLYFLLSGKLPYDADNAVRLIAVVLSGTPTPLTSYRPDISPALDAVVTKCIARKRDDRFANYAALREALVACLPVEQVAAPVLRRMGAGLVDMWILGAIATPAFAAIGSRLGVNLLEMSQHPTLRSTLLQVLISLPLEFAWYGLLEGRLGWTPGKLLAGLRVVRADGGVPGIARGMGRTMFVATSGILLVMLLLVVPTRYVQFLAGTVGFLIPLLFFVRARKSNGFLGEHDRLTGTRVVQAQSTSRRVSIAAAAPDSVPEPSAAAERVGPYSVLESLTPAGNLVSAVDTELKRPVWLVRWPLGTAELPVHERQAVRTTCLRWIGGRRSDSESWDAYAAVRGVPLRQRLTQSAEWSDVQGWLRDVVDEVTSCDDPARTIATRTIDHVWIADDGHAVLLPFALGSGNQSANAAHGLLADLSAAVQQADAAVLQRDRWPLRADSVLGELATASLTTVRDAMAKAALGTGMMTRRLRVSLWGAITVPLAIFIMFSVVAGTMAQGNDPDQLRMEPLLGFLSRKPVVPDTLAGQRAAVATYLSGHFAQTIRAHRTSKDAKGAKGALSAKEWQRADSVLAAMPVVTATALRDADRLVDTVWHGRPPGEMNRAVAIPVFTVALLIVIFALTSVGAAAFARRGLMMRTLNLELIAPDGKPAKRLRLIWRQLLVIAPWLWLGADALWIVFKGANAPQLAVGAVGLALTILSLYSAWRAPARGLTERWSGTRLVPE